MWARSDEGLVAVLAKFVRPVPAGMIYNSDLRKAKKFRFILTRGDRPD